MSIAAESAAPPTARSRLIKYLQERYATVPDNASAQQLRKLAQPWSGDDPIIAHWVRQVEADEQRAREQRDDRQQQQVAQRIEQHIEQQAAEQQEVAQQQSELWWDCRLASALGYNDDETIHPLMEQLLQCIGDANLEREKALRTDIDIAKQYTAELVRAFNEQLKVRFDELKDELKAIVWTQWQTYEKRYAEAMEQVTCQLAGIEAKLSASQVAIADLKCELTDDVDQRIAMYQQQREQDAEQIKALTERLTAVEQQSGDLKHATADGNKRLDNFETAYWDQRDSDQSQRERDEKTSAEQIKTINDRLTAVEQHGDDFKRELTDGSKRLDDLEDAYWNNRDRDQRQHDEQKTSTDEKISGFAQQVGDFAHELKEVRRDLKRATDMTREIHQMELRLDERRIAAEENKRGPQGLPGPKGPKGDAGPAGKAGRDGRDAPTVKTKKWEVKAAEFTAREILSDGSRMPALNLRPLFEEYQRQTS